MGTRYNIAITATDAATARIRAIRQALGSVSKPIADVGRNVRTLGKETGIQRLGSGIQMLRRNAVDATRAIGGLSPALAGVVGIGGITALAAYSKNIIYGQAATLSFARTSGIAAERVQNMQSASKLAGVGVEAMDQSLMNLGRTVQDAKWGRNQGALMLMNRMRLQMRYTKEGAVDTEKVLDDIFDRFDKMPAGTSVQTKGLIASQLGVEGLLPLLLKGRKAWEAYKKEAADLKPPISKKDLERSEEYRRNIEGLALSFDELGTAAANKAAPGIAAVAKELTAQNKHIAENIRQRGFAYALKAFAFGERNGKLNDGQEGRPGPLGDWSKAFGMPKRADRKKEQEALADYRRMGWSDAQAKGLVAQEIAESNINPKAVGDGGKANGLIQHHPDRQANYRRWAADRADVKGKTILEASAAEQRRFITYELREGAEKPAGRKLAQQTDAGQAAADLSRDYVRPWRKHVEAARRRGTAQELDKSFPEKPTQPRRPVTPRRPGEPVPVKLAQAPYKLPESPQGDQNPGGGAMDQVWKSTKPQAQKIDGKMEITLKGVPAGTKAEIVDSQGPVKTTLKIESSMPDYNL